MADASADLLERVQLARASRTTLRICGHGSKAGLLGQRLGDTLLDVSRHSGIERYRPEELVMTVRAGTPLAEVNAALAEQHQCLAADPPEYGGRGTIGGAVASGLTGPSRPFRGLLRDSVLGIEMINGFGERLRFGGEVFKNVAGFDVARLLAGSEGALGVLLSVSIRVAPREAAVVCARSPMSAEDAVLRMRSWAIRPLSLSGLAWADGFLHWRLAGAGSVVDTLHHTLGGEEEPADFWRQLRDGELPGVQTARWRIHVAPATSPVAGETCIDWSGALRWRLDAPPPGTNACPAGDSPLRRGDIDPLLVRIKQAFDPDRIFNPELIHADQSA